MPRNHALPFLFLPLLLAGLFSCQGNEEAKPVNLRFGTLIGNHDYDPISGTSQLTFIKKSKLNQLVASGDNFLLLLHGSSDTCTCFTNWHNQVLAPYIKHNKLLVRAITLTEFESDTEYYGLKRVAGYDTLAVFEKGKAVFQKTTDNETDPFVTTYSGFAEWMGKRTQNPQIFYVDEELLDEFYASNEDFTVYFGRDTCGDCGYLNRTALASYLDTHQALEKNFLYIDFDAYRPSRGDDGYEEAMVHYQEMKDKYGLSYDAENPAGYGKGAFPSVYYVHPDGHSYKGDVIEASGVFYNDSVGEDGKVKDSYFTKERYESGKDTFLTYLADSELTTKWFDDLSLLKESEASNDRHELLSPYEEPIFNALLEYAVGGSLKQN